MTSQRDLKGLVEVADGNERAVKDLSLEFLDTDGSKQILNLVIPCLHGISSLRLASAFSQLTVKHLICTASKLPYQIVGHKSASHLFLVHS